MKATKVKPTVVLKEGTVDVRVPEVHVSADIRQWDFSEDARVLIVLDIASEEPAKIDLKKARLRIEEPNRRDRARGPIASGLGEPPSRLYDGEFAPEVALNPHKTERVWVAFGDFPRRSTRELAQRIELELPLSAKSETKQTITLSDPGKPPIWRGEPVRSSGGWGFSFQLSADEGVANIRFVDLRYHVGPMIIGIASGFGPRTPEWPSDGGQKVRVANLELQARLAWPLLSGRIGSLAPYIGFDSAIKISDDDVRRPHWFGPGVGVEMAMGPFLPRHGPFPIDYPQTPLGFMNFSLGFVHWFGPGREPPSFGMVMSLSVAYAHFGR